MPRIRVLRINFAKVLTIELEKVRLEEVSSKDLFKIF